MVNGFDKPKTGVICGVIGDRHLYSTGVTYISANNGKINMYKDSDQETSTADNKSICYIDANKLYGLAVMQK